MSRSIAIKARRLSKSYPLQTLATSAEYQTLADLLARGVKFPFRMLTGRTSRESSESFWALRDVDFDIQHGEVVGIIGRNGNGKSTLLKILSRITAPTRGWAELRGRVCSLLEVGTGFHPELTGSENIYLNGSILGMTRREIRQKFDEIVAFSEVEKFLDMPVKRYSSGMRVRLAFSVSAHMDPDILIIDEVLAVGDLAFQQKCLKRMSEFASTGRTILFVSHNMPAIESICKRTILLSGGSIVADGSTEQVVAQFIKSTIQSDERLGESTISLRDHPNRSRSSEEILTELKILDSSNSPCCSLKLGSPCSFELAFRSSSIRNGLSFSIGISTEQGQKIAVLHSRINSRVVTNGESAGTVTCRLNELPLLPGNYCVDVSAGTWDKTLDCVEQVGRISVLPSDYFQSGELPNITQGPFALKANWTAARSEPARAILSFDSQDANGVHQPYSTQSKSYSFYDWH